MARTLKSDKWLFLATLLLVGTSIVMVYSASSYKAMTTTGSPLATLLKQLGVAAFGMVVLSVAMRVDYRNYRRQELIWAALVIAFIALVGVLFMPLRNHTHRWFSLGGTTIQPSEFAKLALTIFTAALLERRMHRINELTYSLAPIGIATGLFVLLILKEPDFGTSVAILGIVTALIFAAGVKYRYWLVGLFVMAPVLIGVAFLERYRIKRLQSWLDPWAHQLDGGYQVVQGWIALGSGGIFGRGLMAGVTKTFLPEANTDFIAAVVGEEFGLIGITVLIITFCIIAWRGLRTAVLAPDRFGSLLAIGLTTMVVVQAFFNLSVVTGLVPNKGLPLPLVSNGGSSLLINLVAMGILLNISQQASTVAATKVGVDAEV